MQLKNKNLQMISKIIMINFTEVTLLLKTVKRNIQKLKRLQKKKRNSYQKKQKQQKKIYFKTLNCKIKVNVFMEQNVSIFNI